MDFATVAQLIGLGYYASLTLLVAAAVYVLAAFRRRHWAAVRVRVAYLVSLLLATGTAYGFLLSYALVVRAPGASSAAEAAAKLATWVGQTAGEQLLLSLGLWLALLGANWLGQRLTTSHVAWRQLLALSIVLLVILLGGIILGGLDGYYGLLEEYHRSQP